MLIVRVKASNVMGREEAISFQNASGQILKGIVHHPSGSPAGAAILCHGMESNKESEKLVAVASALAAEGVLTLRFDFACAGESGNFAQITYSGEVEDLSAAFNFVVGYRPPKIGLLGSSMGGAVALLFAAKEKQVAALVTIAAPLHPERLTDRLLGTGEVERWRKQGYIEYHGRRVSTALLDDLQRIRIPEAARNLSCPLLILHGDADETVPVDEAYELYGLANEPKKLCILKGADHRLSAAPVRDQALTEALSWLCGHVAAKA